MKKLQSLERSTPTDMLSRVIRLDSSLTTPTIVERGLIAMRLYVVHHSWLGALAGPAGLAENG